MPQATEHPTPEVRPARAKPSRKAVKKKVDMSIEVMATTKFKATPKVLEAIGPLHEFLTDLTAKHDALRLGLHALTMDDVQMAGNMQEADAELVEAMLETGAFMVQQSKMLGGFARCCKAAGCRLLIVATRVGLAKEAAATGVQS